MQAEPSGDWALLSSEHTWTLATRELVCGRSWPESGNNKNHNNYVNIGPSELRLSLRGKMEKVKSAEVTLETDKRTETSNMSRLLPTHLVI